MPAENTPNEPTDHQTILLNLIRQDLASLAERVRELERACSALLEIQRVRVQARMKCRPRDHQEHESDG